MKISRLFKTALLIYTVYPIYRAITESNHRPQMRSARRRTHRTRTHHSRS